MFTFNETYSLEVAAQNIYGLGSFSNLVIVVFGSQGRYNIAATNNRDKQSFTK